MTHINQSRSTFRVIIGRPLIPPPEQINLHVAETMDINPGVTIAREPSLTEHEAQQEESSNRD